MERILSRWKILNSRLYELEQTLDEGSAFWENEEYAGLFEERARLNQIMMTSRNETDKETIKQDYRKRDRKEQDKLLGKEYTDKKWITINPADGQETAFIAKVHKFMHRSCMKGKYCFEQRGETEGDYHGLHCHALVVYYPNLKRDVVTQFKKFCDQVHIKIMPCTEADVQRRDTYMNGTKQGQQKQAKVANDEKMREYYGLKPIYTC